MWVLTTEPGFSRRAVNVLNHLSIPQNLSVLNDLLFLTSFLNRDSCVHTCAHLRRIPREQSYPPKRGLTTTLGYWEAEGRDFNRVTTLTQERGSLVPSLDPPEAPVRVCLLLVGSSRAHRAVLCMYSFPTQTSSSSSYLQFSHLNFMNSLQLQGEVRMLIEGHQIFLSLVRVFTKQKPSSTHNHFLGKMP